MIPTKEPRCLENHHSDNGELIVFQGAGFKTCGECKSIEECFRQFVKWKEHGEPKRLPIKPKELPDMVERYFIECCGSCQNAIPISTTSRMVVCTCDGKQKNENKICRNLYVAATLW